MAGKKMVNGNNFKMFFFYILRLKVWFYAIKFSRWDKIICIWRNWCTIFGSCRVHCKKLLLV